MSREAFLYFLFLFPFLKVFFSHHCAVLVWEREQELCYNSGSAAEGHEAEQLPLAGGVPGLIPSRGTGKRDPDGAKESGMGRTSLPLRLCRRRGWHPCAQ